MGRPTEGKGSGLRPKEAGDKEWKLGTALGDVQGDLALTYNGHSLSENIGSTQATCSHSRGAENGALPVPVPHGVCALY